MAVPTQLGIIFTPEEEATIDTALQDILTILQSKATFNMSNEERQGLSSVGDERFPYVLRSISNYGVTYPHLNGLAYSHTMADHDLATYGYTSGIEPRLDQITELTTELKQVAGHFCFKFMRQQYKNAEANLAENVAGAQVVYDGLKDCFEGQGPQGG